MGVDKLLYVTDLKDINTSFKVFKRIIPLQKEGYGKIVFCLPSDTSDQWRNVVTGADIDYVIRKADDFSTDNILKAAEEEGASLIVLQMDNSFIGKTMKNLIAKAAIPVLVMNQEKQEKELFEHVIIATNWTPPSEEALKFILGFKELIGELDMIHVITEKLTVKDMLVLKERLAETRKLCLDEGIDAEFHIYAGKTEEEILTAAKDYRGSIIILGTSVDKPFLKRLLMRGTAYNVVEKSDIPLFLVPKTFDRD
jgi:nucleotide-binding universal stress UspA family protein